MDIQQGKHGNGKDIYRGNMRLIDADVFAEISKKHVPEVIVDTWEEGYIDCLKVVDETPTVEAIPIEWIKKWNQKNENFLLYMGLARKLIEDWEEEND